MHKNNGLRNWKLNSANYVPDIKIWPHAVRKKTKTVKYVKYYHENSFYCHVHREKRDLRIKKHFKANMSKGKQPFSVLNWITCINLSHSVFWNSVLLNHFISVRLSLLLSELNLEKIRQVFDYLWMRVQIYCRTLLLYRFNYTVYIHFSTKHAGFKKL